MLLPGGRTIAGPGLVVVPKTMVATLISNYFGNDACVTVVNVSGPDLTLDTNAGAGSLVVAAHESASLCQAALTTATVTCSGSQSGDCRALWRVDR